MKREKKLRCWNGRPWTTAWIGNKKNPDHFDSYYVCAESVSEAVRIIQKLVPSFTRSEITVYASECWGNVMSGITPEKGLWIARGYNSKPERLV